LESQEAEVQGTTIATHPKVERAKSELRKAFLELHRCVVKAPAKGIISNRKAQVGQWVMKEDFLMALIPLNEIWVDANFREVNLKHLRIGQPVEVKADMYGGDVKFHGKVQGLNGGTGSVFSILPPQNASGNWIKIVQRVPVKITLDPKELLVFPLILGLSMNVDVNTHDRTGLRLPEASKERALYKTIIYNDELSEAEKLIEQIVAENIP
jgi:membrane fusion protein (multidrug efflux system)